MVWLCHGGCCLLLSLCKPSFSPPPPLSDDIFPFSRVSLVSWSFCRLLSGVPLFVCRDTSRRISERTTRRSGFHGNEPFHGSIVGSRQDTRRSTPFFCLSTCPRSSNISLHYCRRSRNVETFGSSVAVSSARIDRWIVIDGIDVLEISFSRAQTTMYGVLLKEKRVPYFKSLLYSQKRVKND